MVLCVKDERYPEAKMPGGMAEAVTGGRIESPGETMRREAVSETGVQILSARLLFREKKVDRRSREVHVRNFYLAGQVSALPSLDAPPREVVETNPSNGTTEHLTCFWLPLREFANRLFKEQNPAFGAVLAWLASDDKSGMAFYEEFGDLLEQFPEPIDLGLE